MSGNALRASQVAAALMGGFAFAYGFVGLATLGFFALGLHFFEGQSLAWMLSFLVYLGAILWGFVQRVTSRVWLVLGGGGAVMMVTAWALSRAML